MTLKGLASAISAARCFGEIVGLGELVERHQRGRTTSGLCALTFDDAYATLLGAASDLLRNSSFPATVFVTGAAARAGSAYWWDRIEDLIPRISRQRWREFETACGVPEEYRRGQPAEYGPMRPLRQWILSHYRGRWPEALEDLLTALEDEAGFRTAQRSMTFDQIRALCARAPIDIGLHTMSHPVLSLLDDAEVLSELRECHDLLRQELGRVQPILAIPYGLFDRRTAALARAAGMKASLTVAGATLRNVRVPDLLPRFCIDRAERHWKLELRLAGVADRVNAWRGRRPSEECPELPSATT